MLKMSKISVTIALLTVVLSGCNEGEIGVQAKEPDMAAIQAEIAKIIPLAQQTEVVATDTAGVYRVETNGEYVFAHIKDNRILLGQFYDSETKKNLGESAKSKLVSAKIENTSVDKMIVYKAKDDQPKRHITVFTDIDCGYCRKLHNEVTDLTDAGIEVRYLAFPRAGLKSNSYKKYVSVWCNDDQQAALTAAKNRETVPDATCENPVAESYNLGRSVGVKGTPTMILDDGTIIPGYIPSKRLIKQLGITDDATTTNTATAG